MDQENIFKNSVFRYRSYNTDTLNAFQNDRLYFSTPKHFNDPFDAVIHVNDELLLASIFRDLDEGMPSYLNAKLNDPASYINAANKDLILTFTQDPKCRATVLADILKTITTVEESLLTNSKTICFAEEFLSTLMWSHYADYHKGFVLAYQKDSFKTATSHSAQDAVVPATLKLGKIRYQTHMCDYGEFFYQYLPEISRGTPPALYSRFLTEMLFNKTKEWEYEKEWRLCSIPSDFEKPDPVHYLSIRPWAIFLGAKMPAKQKWQLYNVAKKKDIAVFEIWANNLSPEFKLNFQAVNAKELKEAANKKES